LAGSIVSFTFELIYETKMVILCREGWMAKRKKDSNSNDIKAYRHEKDTRKTAVPVGLASYDTPKQKPKKYEYDPHLDPQLVWSGKKENASFEVPTVSLHIHERTNKVTFAEALSI
jgi:adenine-specific DNA-methyltransferase